MSYSRVKGEFSREKKEKMKDQIFGRRRVHAERVGRRFGVGGDGEDAFCSGVMVMISEEEAYNAPAMVDLAMKVFAILGFRLLQVRVRGCGGHSGANGEIAK
ncbi:hypothetical protein LR48_Vigan07g195200 [Vigna angularis]|uniref:Uncharacterized protein n=1 Tax=Phaseolus angularis TaxID=3914 RepID=A0A0L9UZN7_PHAAN|nr:hypothetical protein LR48_Vigan07g195200 [Vigna angularis]